ncbi:MAG: ABC transporter ATP-binding protein [Desulfurococcaceae archaeon]
MATKVRLEEITKVYGNVVAADNITLEIRPGELFTFLGPSGCGKTTTLRIIAGFEAPDKGRVFFDEEDVTFKKPYQRNTAMVFQNYALWPHMTVYDNIAYGLRLRKIPEDEVRRRVKWALELVRLEGLENRFPLQLSGGQQQRVALARALVVQPRILLLDEPLSNLDAKLRIEMREEVKRIQRELSITTIYVTHDQLEAMSISDRLAIMDKGRVLQVGTPQEIYFRPRSVFVASFIGRSNMFTGKLVERSNAYARIYVDELGVEVEGVMEDLEPSDKVIAIVRPEDIVVEPLGTSINANINVLRGTVEFKMFVGEKQELRVKIRDTSLVAYAPKNLDLSIGQEVLISFSKDSLRALPHK